MIFHAASMAAFFVDQLAQAPVVVQCTQPATESWLKWLLPTITQTIISLTSISAGVLIALWSFRSTSEKDHEQWLLDQKKAEWKELLARIAEIERELPIVVDSQEDHKELVAAAQSILPLLRGMLFVFTALNSSGFIREWEAFVEYLLKPFMRTIRTDQLIQSGRFSGPKFADDRARRYMSRNEKEIEAREKFGALLVKLRGLAHNSLGVKGELP
jgi:hypothetical protein